MSLSINIGIKIGSNDKTSQAIPPNALLDEDGNPILDEDGNFILDEE